MKKRYYGSRIRDFVRISAPGCPQTYHSPTPPHPSPLYCDASDYAFGAVLCQLDDFEVTWSIV